MVESDVLQHLPFQMYSDIPAINSGAISYGAMSMRHMRAYLQGEIQGGDSSARRFGRAAHAKVFEPEQYQSQIAVASTCDATFRSGAKKGALCGKPGKFRFDDTWYCGQHKPDGSSVVVDYVSAEEDKRISRMAESLREHEVGKLLSSKGMSEVSLTWKRGDVWCKGRIDRYVFASPDNRPIIIDMKKCQVGTANRSDAERSIYNYGWHRQAAMYCWGAEKCFGGARPDFLWVFVEDSPPYDICVLQADNETLQIGFSEIRQVIDQWSKAVAEDVYPGREQAPQSGGLPVFARPHSSD